MKILISGASGLIGSALISRLTSEGHDAVPLARPRDWNPDAGTIDRGALEAVDVVIHLAGENVFGRWTDAKKERIRGSRVAGTRVLTEALAKLSRKPRLLLSASAIGYYGDRAEEELTEQSSPGDDFLAQVTRDWEVATRPAAQAGIRVVNMRFGVVLDPQGGALAKMLPPFRIGLGGPVGSGDQYVSWISIDDIVNAVLHLMQSEKLSGPINLTAPTPVTNREFAKTLGRVLGRPAVVAVPGFALRMAFGSEGAAMLQGGQRVLPKRLLESGFKFRFDALEPALRHLLAAPPSGS